VKPSRGAQPVEMHQTQGADVIIAEVHADGGPTEYVTIVNRGTVDQPLTGWAIASMHGLGVFSFPAGTVLPAGGMLRILSGEGAQALGRGDLVWVQENVWSNRSDTVLLLTSRDTRWHGAPIPARPSVRTACPNAKCWYANALATAWSIGMRQTHPPTCANRGFEGYRESGRGYYDAVTPDIEAHFCRWNCVPPPQ